MPYKNLQSLPENLRSILPHHAQEIFLEAYNHAATEYKSPRKRRAGSKESLEEVAHKVAWAAVKKKYKKDSATGSWVEK